MIQIKAKERKPNIQRWVYLFNQRRWESPDYISPLTSVKVAIVADRVWWNFCIFKLKELSNLLGYELKKRNEISDYRARRLKRIRIDKRCLYLLPLDNSSSSL